MGLSDVVRSAMKVANKVTKDLQPQITIQRWIGGGGYEGEQYASPIQVDAVVNVRLQDHHTASGQVVSTRAHVMILQPLPAEGSEGRIEPIDRRDIITLPDGSSGPIVEVGGFTDRKTGMPFYHEIWIGAGSTSGNRQ
jgi:hypothetical protein